MYQLLTFLSGALFYFLLDIFKIYYKKRIERKATIEDLPDMTKIVESIKQESRKELSSIKAQLSVLTNQSSLINEKSIEVLNQFFERCLEIKDLNAQSFGAFKPDNLAQSMLDYQMSVELVHRKLYSNYHNLVLFHNKNSEIIKNATDIVSSSNQLRIKFKEHFGSIKHAILEEVSSYRQGALAKDEIENSNNVVSEYYAARKDSFTLFNKHFSNLLKSLSSYFSEYGLKYNHSELENSHI